MKKISFKDLILLENDNYIVINKPPGVSSLDERDSTRQNVLKLAKAYSGDVQLAHRLDKETSGALAIAKTPESYRHISVQFEKRKLVKCYHAIALGLHDFDMREVKLPIAVSGRGTVRIDREEGKKSLTVFNSIKHYKYHTLVECWPHTGRMHQIRIHLACVKAPIVADEMYGGPNIFLSDIKRGFKLKKGEEELPLIQRFALHAYSLEFEDLSGETIRVQAPYPKDFRALDAQLSKNS